MSSTPPPPLSLCMCLFVWIRKHLVLFYILYVWLSTAQVTVVLACFFDLVHGPVETQACVKIEYRSENLVLMRVIPPWLECTYDIYI